MRICARRPFPFISVVDRDEVSADWRRRVGAFFRIELLDLVRSSGLPIEDETTLEREPDFT